ELAAVGAVGHRPVHAVLDRLAGELADLAEAVPVGVLGDRIRLRRLHGRLVALVDVLAAAGVAVALPARVARLEDQAIDLAGDLVGRELAGQALAAERRLE